MILLAVGIAAAEVPPPDYGDTLQEAGRNEVASRAKALGVEAALEFVQRWERTVGPDARVEYELGLAYRLAGDDKGARTWLDAAIARDPKLVAARYDRGEIRLGAGDVDGADADFQVCTELEPRAWPGWFRRADVAARRGDAKAFEESLATALRYGFPLLTVTADRQWRGYWRDAALGPVLRKLGAVYAPPGVLDAFDAEPSK